MVPISAASYVPKSSSCLLYTLIISTDRLLIFPGWTQSQQHHGFPKPSSRLVSTQIISTDVVSPDTEASHMLMQWGQFLDHDIDFSLPAISHESFVDGTDCSRTCDYSPPCFPIEIPPGDRRIRGHSCMEFVRSSAICGSGVTSVFLNEVMPREQANQLTSFIDASNVYGSSERLSQHLRNLTNNLGLLRHGPLMQSGKPLLPFNDGQPIDCQRDPTASNIGCFLAGDIRANEQLGLLSMHTLWMREHNRIAGKDYQAYHNLSPPVFSRTPQDTEATLGSNIELPCQARGDPEPRITWRKNRIPLNIDSDHYRLSSRGDLYMFNIVQEDQGSYECIAENEVGHAAVSIRLSIRAAPYTTYPGDRYVVPAVENARRAVEEAVNHTLHYLFSRDRNRTPNHLLQVFRFPSPEARDLAKAAEIYEKALLNVRGRVEAGVKLNLTEFRYSEILSPHQMELLTNLSGCQAHRQSPSCSNMCFHRKYRTFDGSCNNLQHSTWGSSLTPFLRLLPAVYENGFNTPVAFQPIPEGNIELHRAFFAPHRLVEEGGIDPLLRGLFYASAKIKRPDQLLNSQLTEHLFELAHEVALDLAAMNIQRGRDHAIPSYNEWRKFCNLSVAENFDDLKNEIKDQELRTKLQNLYGHPGNVDLWVGGLSEESTEGARIGPTFTCILVDQFKRLRDGDRYWYDNPGVFSPDQLVQVKQTTLARVICDNGDNITHVTRNVFIVPGLQTPQFVECSEIPKVDLRMWSDCCHGCEDSGDFNSVTTLSRRTRRSLEYSYPDEKPLSFRMNKLDNDVVSMTTANATAHAPSTESQNIIQRETDFDATEERIEGLEDLIHTLERTLHKLYRKVRHFNCRLVRK
ncbi:peroxidasin-like [Limulus polyphemus]|uniref:Peroxidasin-like n=1 Tax=Limulus polyphemus TaxID=6850 RepID=A0ABM1RYQ7_LIMPO|nr:peroxidasin-like [Limulus polyphemus]